MNSGLDIPWRIHGAGIYIYMNIYANIGGILMGSMLPYIAAPWILWVWFLQYIFIICQEIQDPKMEEL